MFSGGIGFIKESIAILLGFWILKFYLILFPKFIFRSDFIILNRILIHFRKSKIIFSQNF